MNCYTTDHANKVRTALKCFIANHRQYRGYDVSSLRVGKVWNRGMGCADLFRVHPDDNMIYAARGMFSKCDERHIPELIDKLNNATGKRYVWKVIDAEPYPSMSIRIPQGE